MRFLAFVLFVILIVQARFGLAAQRDETRRDEAALACIKLMTPVAIRAYDDLVSDEKNKILNLLPSNEIFANETFGMLVSWISLKPLSFVQINSFQERARAAGIIFLSDMSSQTITVLGTGDTPVLLTTLGFSGAPAALKKFIEESHEPGLAFRIVHPGSDLATDISQIMTVRNDSDISGVTTKFESRSPLLILVSDLNSKNFVGLADAKTLEEYLQLNPSKIEVSEITSGDLKSQWGDVISNTSQNTAIYKIDSKFYVVSQNILSSIQLENDHRALLQRYFAAQRPSVQSTPQREETAFEAAVPHITISDLRQKAYALLGPQGSTPLDSARPIVVIEKLRRPVLLAIKPTMAQLSADELEAKFRQVLDVPSSMRFDPRIISGVQDFRTRSVFDHRIESVASFSKDDFPYSKFINSVIDSTKPVLLLHKVRKQFGSNNPFMILVPIRFVSGVATPTESDAADNSSQVIDDMSSMLELFEGKKAVHNKDSIALLKRVKKGMQEPSYRSEAKLLIEPDVAVINQYLSDNREYIKDKKDHYRYLLSSIGLILNESQGASETPPNADREETLKYNFFEEAGGRVDSEMLTRFYFTSFAWRCLKDTQSNKLFRASVAKALGEFANGKIEAKPSTTNKDLLIIRDTTAHGEIRVLLMRARTDRIIVLSAFNREEGYERINFSVLLRGARTKFPELF
jgi:hypothetical protein